MARAGRRARRSHHLKGQRIKELIEERERALYLPPYSPDLDPIEEAFSKIKGFFEKPRHAPKRPQSRCWDGDFGGHRLERPVASLSIAGTAQRFNRYEERCKKAIREITEVENKAEATEAVKKFAQEFGTKEPKAVAIADEKEMLLAYYDYPAEH